MSFTLKKDEFAAWDLYASEVLATIASSRPGSADEMSHVAASFADEMIKRRRERAQPPAEIPPLKL